MAFSGRRAPFPLESFIVLEGKALEFYVKLPPEEQQNITAACGYFVSAILSVAARGALGFHLSLSDWSLLRLFTASQQWPRILVLSGYESKIDLADDGPLFVCSEILRTAPDTP